MPTRWRYAGPPGARSPHRTGRRRPTQPEPARAAPRSNPCSSLSMIRPCPASCQGAGRVHGQHALCAANLSSPPVGPMRGGASIGLMKDRPSCLWKSIGGWMLPGGELSYRVAEEQRSPTTGETPRPKPHKIHLSPYSQQLHGLESPGGHGNRRHHQRKTRNRCAGSTGPGRTQC